MGYLCDYNHVHVFSYPDPLPPTNATFFPAGALNDNPLKIGLSSTYWKCTSSNVIVNLSGGRIRFGALGFSFKTKGEQNQT